MDATCVLNCHHSASRGVPGPQVVIEMHKLGDLAHLSFTPRQRREVERLLLAQQRQGDWHGQLPVLLLNRCWLRLEIVALERLAVRLPPDSTASAPELERFRQWREAGLSPTLAEARCWEEFGQQACRAAQRRHWEAQDRGQHGWTLEAYLHFLHCFRERFTPSGPRPLPLFVLGRGGSGERHRLYWLVASAAADAAHLPPD